MDWGMTQKSKRKSPTYPRRKARFQVPQRGPERTFEDGRGEKAEALGGKDEKCICHLEKSRIRTVKVMKGAMTRDSPVRETWGGEKMWV